MAILHPCHSFFAFKVSILVQMIAVDKYGRSVLAGVRSLPLSPNQWLIQRLMKYSQFSSALTRDKVFFNDGIWSRHIKIERSTRCAELAANLISSDYGKYDRHSF